MEFNKDLLIATFKLRLLSLLGFAPNINRCVSCHNEDNLNLF